MRLEFSRVRRITPIWNNNKSLPENEQIAFEYTPLEYGAWMDATEVLGKVINAARGGVIEEGSDAAKIMIESFKRLLPPNVKSVGAPLLPAPGDDAPITLEEIATKSSFIKLAVELLATLTAISTPTEQDVKN